MTRRRIAVAVAAALAALAAASAVQAQPTVQLWVQSCNGGVGGFVGQTYNGTLCVLPTNAPTSPALPATLSLDFSQATNSQYVTLVFY